MVASSGAQASLIGKTLGNYLVKALIGRGAMGTVYLAEDEALHRSVALKVLLGNLARNEEQVKLFQAEAQAASPLQHANIVRIYEAGVCEGTPFIAMEYIEGEPLNRFMNRQGPLEWQQGLYVAQQVLEALDCAHRAGVVHCDIKPSNILLDHLGRVRLTDFGIARAQGGGSDLSQGFSTPQYMSPEQCANRGTIGPGSDLFSLGVTLFQMFAGRLPFEGDSAAALINSITMDSPPRLNTIMMGIPDDVARFVAHMLEKNPRKRPASSRLASDSIHYLLQEGGGSSALPEALNSFIREQSQPRQVGHVTPTPKHQAVGGRRITLTQGNLRYSATSALAKVAVSTLSVVALLGVGYWHFIRPGQIPAPAPELGGVTFLTQEDATHVLNLPSKDWHVSMLRWVGNRAVVLASMRGRSGSPVQGADGVLSIDVESGQVYSVRPPTGPVLDANYWSSQLPQHALGAIYEMPEASPFHDAMLYHAYPPAGRQRGGSAVTLAQGWNEATPRYAVLSRTPLAQWSPPSSGNWENISTGHSVVSPDGYKICMLLGGSFGESNFLVERDVRWRSDGRKGPALTTEGTAILPSSVQYSPDGTKIAYMRSDDSAIRELWIVAPGTGEKNGNPIALGPLLSAAAFSPDSEVMAVNLSDTDGDRILLVRVADGSVVGRMGSGRLSSEAWHPSGKFLVVTDFDAGTGQRQLWAVEGTSPYRRVVLTGLEEGVLSGASVSRDGSWVVVPTATRQTEALLFIGMGTSPFSA